MFRVAESGVFAPTYKRRLAAALHRLGHQLVEWNEEWWETGFPKLDGPTVFHGSLNNADAIRSSASHSIPRAFCATDAFHCSAWYPGATEWMLQSRYTILPAREFADNPAQAFDTVGATNSAFVRPDSPLKPFSGRVVQRNSMSLAALDHGFYFHDESIPVVVAPVCEVGQEWRFVIVDGQVVAGSGYVADGRRAEPQVQTDTAWRFAAGIAEKLRAPEPVYVLDVCDTPAGPRLLELNPFSGADLYACDLEAVVSAVAAHCCGPRGC